MGILLDMRKAVNVVENGGMGDSCTKVIEFQGISGRRSRN